MEIHVRTAGGGGVVLLVIIALAAGGGGAGMGTALAAVLIALAVVVALALGGLVAFLVYRARREHRAAAYRAQAELSTARGQFTAPRQLSAAAPRAIEAPPVVRLHPEQLAELAEILRQQHQRPE